MSDRNIPNETVFPRETKYSSAWGTIQREGCAGLTKRELFAAMVMQGMYAQGYPPHSEQDDITRNDGCFKGRLRRAEEAVRAANALLAALKETP